MSNKSKVSGGTDRPNEMWGTDGIRIQTVEDGWVWVFPAVDHCDACCVGIHAGRIGNRFAALEPIVQALAAEFGATGADIGRGLALRMDNGTQYTADDFPNQIRFWGIAPSFAFVAEPQTNGVAGRFNRRLTEQAIHGRIFRNLEEVRAAVTEFAERYNRHWRLENEVSAQPKTGLHVTPGSPPGSCHEKGGMTCNSVSKQSGPAHAPTRCRRTPA